MRLESFEVTRYRNVVGSGVIEVEPDVTCLVGKNEAGKSAILSALHHANPADAAPFNLLDEYPRWMLVDDRRAGVELADVAPIHATFGLEGADRVAIAALVGPGVLTSDAVTIERSYGGTLTCAAGPLDEACAVAFLLEPYRNELGLSGLLGSRTIAELLASAARLGDGADDSRRERVSALTDSVHALFGGRSLDELVGDALVARLPTFFHFDNYSLLPGRIDLDALARNGGPHGLHTARALLRLAQTDASTLIGGDYELRRAELEAASRELSEQVLRYWTQSSTLDVSIDIDAPSAAPRDGEGQVKRFLEVRVHDKRHGYTGNLAQRSSGFQWFFSFLAAFSYLASSDRSAIVLLDEPALSLHACAQRDLLRFIDARLAPGSQVIYTTHSPAMVEQGRPERVRIVTDHGPPTGAIVTRYTTDADADAIKSIGPPVAPVAAPPPGRDAPSLLIDGATAFTYVTVLSEHLRSLGRRGLDERWNVMPAAGATSIATFATLGGEHAGLTLFLEPSTVGSEQLDRLARRGLIDRKRIVEAADVTGATGTQIEDLFTSGDYVGLFNAALGEQRVVSELPPGERIVERLAELRGAAFDAGAVAGHLLDHRESVLPRLSETTLRRYEELCARLNGERLAPPIEETPAIETPSTLDVTLGQPTPSPPAAQELGDAEAERAPELLAPEHLSVRW